MTKKALNFVVNGMLSNEPEIARERIAYILSRVSQDVIDSFTDGFVIDMKIVDGAALSKWIATQNKDKHILRVDAFNFENREVGDARLNVALVYTVYRRQDGKDYDYKFEKTEEYCIKGEKINTFTIPLNAETKVPGLELIIL